MEGSCPRARGRPHLSAGASPRISQSLAPLWMRSAPRTLCCRPPWVGVHLPFMRFFLRSSVPLFFCVVFFPFFYPPAMWGKIRLKLATLPRISHTCRVFDGIRNPAVFFFVFFSSSGGWGKIKL